MTKMDTPSEFREVHAAHELLDLYLKSGGDPKVIRDYSAPIQRHDVWMAVFEKHRPAVRQLQIKEFYNDCLRHRGADEHVERIVTLTLVTRLNQLVEWKTPLSAKDAVDLIVDVLGKDILPMLISQAQYILELRRGIIKPYRNKDDEWVGYAVKVHKLLTDKQKA
jgi:hypothetical protein